MIKLTPKAAQRVKVLAAKQGKPGGFLRVKVGSGGCAGLSYEFEITEQAAEGDLISELDGARVAVDAKSDFFISGSVVDYAETLMKAGFEIKNPQAASTCSCGTSFAVAEKDPAETTFKV